MEAALLAVSAPAAASASSASAVALDLAIMIGLAFAGYWLAQSTRRSIGTTPWRLPALVWAFLSMLLPVIGLLLEFVARFTTRPVNATPYPGRPTELMYGSSGQQTPTIAGSPPAYPSANPAGGATPWPAHTDPRPGPNGWTPSLPGLAGPADPPPLFGWYPDPDGRHEFRYWDGRVWSEYVSDAGVTSTDPLPPQPASWGSDPPEPPR